MAWNPSDKDADVVLSNSDLTATLSTSFNEGVRGVESNNAGLKYIEFTIVGFDTDMGVGFADAAATRSDISAHNFVVRGFGNVGVNGGSFADGLGYTTGDILCGVIDFTHKRGWFRKNNGNWNGDPTANPATNTGGHDLTFLSWSWTDLFPYAYLKSSLAFGGSANDAVTVNETGPFSFTMPSGATAWQFEQSSSDAALSSNAALAEEISSDILLHEAISSDKILHDAASSDKAIHDALSSELAREAKSSNDALSSDFHALNSDQFASSNRLLAEQVSSDILAHEAKSSDDAVSSELAREAKSSDDALSSDTKPARDAASSEAIREAASSDALLSEQISSDIQVEIRNEPAPPIQVIGIVS